MQTVTTRSAGLIGKGSGPGGTPVNEFLLIPFGPVHVDRPLSGGDFEFTREHARQAVQWFGGLGRKLAIDYEHQSLGQFNVRPDRLSPAAGWVGRLEIRGDGLWAAGVEWTEQARTLLARGEYKYFSPVVYWADEDYTDVAGLGPVALTNDPAMQDVMPLAASRRRPMVMTAFQARPLNGDSESGGSAIAAIVEAFREAHRALMGELDQADAATRGAVADELSGEDYELFDAASNALFSLREMTATAAGSRGGIPAAGGAALVARARREFAASPALQAEFGDAATYVAYTRAAAAGCVRIVGSRATGQARPSTAGASPGFNEAALRRAYGMSVALQREFGGDLEAFIAFKKHDQAGHVQILGAKR